MTTKNNSAKGGSASGGKEIRRYIVKERLDKLINFAENADYKEGAFDSVSGKLTIPFPPIAADLVRLHKLIRARKCFTVLEFGLGYSTLIMADALMKNRKDWQALPKKPAIRNRFMFKLFTVEASRSWMAKVRADLPANLRDIVEFCYSGVQIGTFNGQLCHYYKNLPDIVPDFIYLDGPIAKDVKGAVNGMTFKCDERTVMSGDLLLMEPTFLPGLFIIIDGRTNNARFLENNFKRKYRKIWDREGDGATTFELIEERLGKYNLLGSDFF